jgi:hypothetical protein
MSMIGHNPDRSNSLAELNQYQSYYGDLLGPFAMIGRKLRQARKGATVATDSCAGVWLGRLPPVSLKIWQFTKCR